MTYERKLIRINGTSELIEALENNKESKYVGSIPWGDFCYIILESNTPRKYTKKVKE